MLELVAATPMEHLQMICVDTHIGLNSLHIPSSLRAVARLFIGIARYGSRNIYSSLSHCKAVCSQLIVQPRVGVSVMDTVRGWAVHIPDKWEGRKEVKLNL